MLPKVLSGTKLALSNNKILFSFLNFAGHPCAGAMLIFSVFISFLLMAPPFGGPLYKCVALSVIGVPTACNCGRVMYPIVVYYRVPKSCSKKPSTPWCSRAVPQLSTDLALHRLAMEFEWDPAHSMQYGRRLLIIDCVWCGQCLVPDSHYYRVHSLSNLLRSCIYELYPIVVTIGYFWLNYRVHTLG
jgi:hypothetical protein